MKINEKKIKIGGYTIYMQKKIIHEPTKATYFSGDVSFQSYKI
mgnify:CR=1 FL=1